MDACSDLEPKAQLNHVQVALLSPFVQREVLRSGHGVSESDPVVLPRQVQQHTGVLARASSV